MTSQKLILLLAIIKSLKGSQKVQISFKEILKLYNVICENTKLKPRSYSQLWNYLQEFHRENLILLKVQSENIKGRKSFVKIPNIELSKFEMIIINILIHRGLKI